ncbi:MAG: bactofilin family protein [Chitinophagales bacterium]
MAASKGKKTSSESINAVSIFGKDMYIDGSVYSKVDIRVDGIIEGEVECEGRVIMGDESYLEVIKLKTDTVTINGKLTGDIFASTGIVIGTKGKVSGNLSTPNLQVDQGALVNGNIKMES